jgi:hypothetical protein
MPNKGQGTYLTIQVIYDLIIDHAASRVDYPRSNRLRSR